MFAKVAIVTRTRDRQLLLERAINSVLSQSFDDWIHVIVNDGGDRRLVDELVSRHFETYAGRLLVIHHDRSTGMEAASNAGILASESEYILIHDDDDSLEVAFLLETTRYLDTPPSPAIFGVATLVNRVEEVLDEDVIQIQSKTIYRSLGPCLGIDEMARVNPCPPISFLFRRSAIEKIGYFDEKLPVLGDWDFGIRFISHYDIGVIQEPLANYHLRPAVKSGIMSNTIHGQIDKHRFYDTLVRNRYTRSEEYWAIGQLMQMHGRFDGPRAQLSRLYRHPVIGRVIRAWARFINPDIMSRTE